MGVILFLLRSPYLCPYGHVPLSHTFRQQEVERSVRVMRAEPGDGSHFGFEPGAIRATEFYSFTNPQAHGPGSHVGSDDQPDCLKPEGVYDFEEKPTHNQLEHTKEETA